MSTYDNMTVSELVMERYNLKGRYVDVRYQLDESSADYHEKGIVGDKYKYAKLKKEERSLENDIQLLDELIEQRKADREGDSEAESKAEPKPYYRTG